MAQVFTAFSLSIPILFMGVLRIGFANLERPAIIQIFVILAFIIPGYLALRGHYYKDKMLIYLLIGVNIIGIGYHWYLLQSTLQSL